MLTFCVAVTHSITLTGCGCGFGTNDDQSEAADVVLGAPLRKLITLDTRVHASRFRRRHDSNAGAGGTGP